MKHKKNTHPAVQPTRKQLRKQKRQQVKVKRNEWYTHRKTKNAPPAKPSSEPPGAEIRPQSPSPAPKDRVTPKSHAEKQPPRNPQTESVEEQWRKERLEQAKLQRRMEKQRNVMLKQANVEEDRTIRMLEKQLKLNKRKSKAVPKSFAEDGLDYILEVCDSETMKDAVAAEQHLYEANVEDQFDEDLALIAGKSRSSKRKREVAASSEEDSEEDSQGEGSEGEDSEGDNSEGEGSGDDSKGEDSEGDDSKGEDSEGVDSEGEDSEGEDSEGKDSEHEESVGVDSEEEEPQKKKIKPDGTWEDIYGRTRTKDGGVVTESQSKYIPPAIRAKMAGEMPEDKKRAERLNKLNRQMKGLMNKLAESNMHSIATQLEDLYMNNSRSDMNTLLTKLIFDSLVTNILAPERLLLEHVMLIAILHANVGAEVGANFLQTVAKKFDQLFETSGETDVEDKTLDNVVTILAQLYSFKLIDGKLVHEICNQLAEKFGEKEVECILHVLRGVGFSLRKDDPLALKSLILNLQNRAANSSEATRDNPRVKFMLDVLLAIKNNNVTKIPNYDPTYSEHLKKIMKGFIRKGNYVSQLNIPLEDLLKAEERGKWWIVGSAWTGNIGKRSEGSAEKETKSFSAKLLELARKHGMNSDIRRTIFCTIMSAEDYLDAFEKLLRLGLKNQQERDIINVIIHCSLQEKTYNPFYSVLAQKFCEHDRRFQMTIKYSTWDKLKTLSEQSKTQKANLAKLLTHLFLQKALPITTLKVMEFSELDKLTSSFIRLVLFGILLHEDAEACMEVFTKLAHSEKLKMFRERLKLFIHQFILNNLKAGQLSEELKKLLKERARLVIKVLSSKERLSWD